MPFSLSLGMTLKLILCTSFSEPRGVIQSVESASKDAFHWFMGTSYLRLIAKGDSILTQKFSAPSSYVSEVWLNRAQVEQEVRLTIEQLRKDALYNVNKARINADADEVRFLKALANKAGDKDAKALLAKLAEDKDASAKFGLGGSSGGKVVVAGAGIGGGVVLGAGGLTLATTHNEALPLAAQGQVISEAQPGAVVGAPSSEVQPVPGAPQPAAGKTNENREDPKAQE